MLEKIEQNEKDLIEQEEINKRLENICEQLKIIPNMKFNCIEYISALLYVIYEKKQDLERILKISKQDINYILIMIDNEIEKIRQKEKSEKLFINIKFTEVLEIKNYEDLQTIIVELIKLIIELEQKGEGKKIISKAYEYIVMKSASNNEIKSENGEFYTPQGVIKTITKLLDIQKNMAIYNPACGTGNFIVESVKYAGNIYAFGEEINIKNYNICMTNLWLHDIFDKRIIQNSGEQMQLVDIAMSNPPFTDDTKENVEMNRNLLEIYYKYGITETASSYIKYLIRMIESIDENGKIGIILPHGFLFKQTKNERHIREILIEKKYIDAIISLPEKLFYNTKIPVIILIINKNRKKDNILFIDASREYTKKRKTNILSVKNQEKIVDTYCKRENIQNYSYVAEIDEIKENNYDLSINKYIQIHNEINYIDEEEIKRSVSMLEEEKYEIERKIEILIKNMNL